MAIRLIFLGDIVGTPGRQAVAQCLPRLREQFQPDLVIANAENAAGGSGLTADLYKKLCAAGVDAMTLGDHVYRKVQITHTLESVDNLIRPANLPAAAKGRGWMQLTLPDKPPIIIVTLLGRLFMNLPADSPFAAIDQLLVLPAWRDAVVIVEIHAEATSEKQALGWHVNGRVSAVVGTHTHVATADARILGPAPGADGAITAGGTAYISDLGMCGPHESVLGRQIDRVLKQMTTAMPAPFDVAQNDVRLNGVYLEIDERSRRAIRIERIEAVADAAKPPFTA